MSWRVLCLLLGLAVCLPAAAQILPPPANHDPDAPPSLPPVPLKKKKKGNNDFDMSYLHPKTGLIDPIKEAEILKIMKRTGEEEYYDKMKQAMLDRMRERQPGVPPEIWDRVAKDLDVDTLLQRERAIYDHYYTLDQLKALNAFYDTPAGQHLIDITPALTADTRVVMREWEQQASVKVMLELQDAKLVMPSVPATNSAPPAPSAPTPATNSAPVPPSAPIQSAPMQPAPASHTS